MLIATIQLFLTAIACGLLFVAWRAFRSDRTISTLVAIGFLVRAIAGQALFWISYLHLPFLRRLQAGDGFWFYATDGRKYFRYVAEIARRGSSALTHLDPNVDGSGFTHILVVFGLLFGIVASMALLMNLAAYLGTCAIVVKLAGEHVRVARVVVATIALSPSSILWSTQPLKDVLFLFLFALFVATAAMWIRAWHREKNAALHGALMTLALLAVFCLIAGIRWYWALALFGVSAPLLFVASLRTRKPLHAVMLLIVMYGGVLAGAVRVTGRYLPPPIRAWITSPRLEDAKHAPVMMAWIIDGARSAFDRMDGGTRIGGAEYGHPESRPTRFLRGCVAFFLPHAFAGIGGGRGLWAFADVDTIFFDVVFLIAIVALFRMPREQWRNPILWLVLVVTIAMGAAFIYCVSNFGALFRYRSMIFIGVAMIPVVAVWKYDRAAVPVHARDRESHRRVPLDD
ncbi:MAG: hypothetical protein DMF56_18795 [Acidobacteria bacterium]|nr:MAG: hypothetical protein DMF56_18795 [Acidobacteriota bacterium]